MAPVNASMNRAPNPIPCSTVRRSRNVIYMIRYSHNLRDPGFPRGIAWPSAGVELQLRALVEIDPQRAVIRFTPGCLMTDSHI